MTQVTLKVPSSIPDVQLPSSGMVKSNWILTGSDGVQITILKNTNTFYNGDTHVFNSIQSGNTLYQFKFPVNTTVSTDTTTYTTPANSIYVFSDNSTSTMISNQWIKNVTSGTITITVPVVQPSLEDTSIGTLSMADIAKESPFYSLLLVVYKLSIDMISIFIFWTLFISISCWTKVSPGYLYPSDVHQYPFVFYQANIRSYNVMKPEGENICTLISEKDKIPKLVQQEAQFKDLRELKGDVKEILDAIYPSMLKMGPEGVNTLSGFLLNKCIKEDNICTWDLVVFLVLKICLNNYLYCNTVLSFIHGVAFFLYKEVISSIHPILSILLFALVLFSLHRGVEAMNHKVIRKFNIHFEKETSIAAICLNEFYRLLVTILSCCLSLILPICSFLVITTLIATAYTLFTTLINANSATLGILSFLTLSFSITSYVLILVRFGQKMDPLKIIESIFGKPVSAVNFFTMFGVTLPILMGIGYSLWIGLFLFFTFFKFLKQDEVIKTLKTSSASIVLVALLLLMIHVKEILGNTYTMMTFIIIVLIGAYVSTLIGK
jgi:hypothetical protein